jgi:hypothetical protein
MRGDAFIDHDAAHRLVHLDSNGTVSEGLDGLESDALYCAVVLVESARTQAVRDDLALFLPALVAESAAIAVTGRVVAVPLL